MTATTIRRASILGGWSRAISVGKFGLRLLCCGRLGSKGAVFGQHSCNHACPPQEFWIWRSVVSGWRQARYPGLKHANHRVLPSTALNGPQLLSWFEPRQQTAALLARDHAGLRLDLGANELQTRHVAVLGVQLIQHLRARPVFQVIDDEPINLQFENMLLDNFKAF